MAAHYAIIGGQWPIHVDHAHGSPAPRDARECKNADDNGPLSDISRMSLLPVPFLAISVRLLAAIQAYPAPKKLAAEMVLVHFQSAVGL